MRQGYCRADGQLSNQPGEYTDDQRTLANKAAESPCMRCGYIVDLAYIRQAAFIAISAEAVSGMQNSQLSFYTSVVMMETCRLRLPLYYRQGGRDRTSRHRLTHPDYHDRVITCRTVIP